MLVCMLERSWQALQSRVSVARKRKEVSWLRPLARSTVTATARQPAFSARFTRACATSHLLVAESWYQIGCPRALVTSSTPRLAAVDKICRWLPTLAARAQATSPSSWKDLWPPIGASTIGLAYFTPRISVDMSTLLTSIGAHRDLVFDAPGHGAKMHGGNVLAADRLEIEDVDRLLGRLDEVVRAHGRPHQRIVKLAAGRRPFAGERVQCARGPQRTPGQELQELAPASGLIGERRHGEPPSRAMGAPAHPFRSRTP